MMEPKEKISRIKFNMYKDAWNAKKFIQTELANGESFSIAELESLLGGVASVDTKLRLKKSGLEKEDIANLLSFQRIISDFENEVIDLLEKYICKTINDFSINSPVEFEDAKNNCYLQIVEHLHEYNPDYSLTTFFKPHFKYALRTTLKNGVGAGGMSEYYRSTLTMINKVERYLKENGIPATEENIYKYSAIVLDKEIPVSTIRNTLMQKNSLMTNELDADKNNDYSDSEFAKSPENEYIAKELANDVQSALMSLPKLERLAFCMLYEIGCQKKTLKQISVDPVIVRLCEERGIETIFSNIMIKAKNVEAKMVPENVIKSLINSARRELIGNPIIVSIKRSHGGGPKAKISISTENIVTVPSAEILNDVALVCAIEVDD